MKSLTFLYYTMPHSDLFGSSENCLMTNLLLTAWHGWPCQVGHCLFCVRTIFSPFNLILLLINLSKSFLFGASLLSIIINNKKLTSILLFNKNNHLNIRINSCLHYLLWERPWFGKSVKVCSLMHTQEPPQSLKTTSIT